VLTLKGKPLSGLASCSIAFTSLRERSRAATKIWVKRLPPFSQPADCLGAALLGPSGRTLPYQGQDSSRPAVSQSDYESLEKGDLPVPVPGAERQTLVDSFNDMRGSGRHEALDIPAERGTPVIAVDDGEAKKLFFSVRGGLTVYQFDPGETYCYYYAHLDRYAEGLQEGQFLKRGSRIGYVGATGDASPDSPHLHFAIFKLGPEKRLASDTH